MTGNEVYDVVTNDMLTQELDSLGISSQVFPKNFFSNRRILPVLSGELFQKYIPVRCCCLISHIRMSIYSPPYREGLGEGLLEGDIDNCQNFCTLAGGTMHMMFHDGIVENAVALLQRVSLLAIDDFHLALHDVDELLALVGR